MSASWRASLPCTRAEGEAGVWDMGGLSELPEPPVLATVEPDPTRPDEWRLDAYLEDEPDADALAMLARLAPSAGGVAPVVERVPEQDWVTLSQAGLEPIRAGCFLVHTPEHPSQPQQGVVPLRIAAGRAFGTGHHQTTAGCLEMLDRLRRQGARVNDLLDVGTGTGLLAFAALALWPRARALATDIDPVSIDVAEENAAANGVMLGGGRGQLALAAADGLEHPLVEVGAPYDLVTANILAQPLIDLAPAIADATAPGGSVLLAGLLDHQAEVVTRAYRAAGFRLADRIDRGPWPTLRMRRRPCYRANV